jgi:hypothetical protein
MCVWPTGRCDQPRLARPAGVAPSDSRSTEQLRVAVNSQMQPRAARLNPRNSERQEAPLSQVSHANGYSRARASCGVVLLWLLLAVVWFCAILARDPSTRGPNLGTN